MAWHSENIDKESKTAGSSFRIFRRIEDKQTHPYSCFITLLLLLLIKAGGF